MDRLILAVLLLSISFSAKAQELDRPADFVVPLTIVLDLDNPARLPKLEEALVQSRADLARATTASELRAIQEHRRAIKMEILRLRRAISLVAKK
jgi:hypothetical protein